MLNIFTDLDLIKDKPMIFNIDARFNTTINVPSLTSEMKDYLKEIDNIEVLPNNYIKTDCGECTLDCLASGIKAVLLIMKYKNEFVYNVNCCGSNVLKKIFELGNTYDISIYLRHIEIPSDVLITSEINLNNTKIPYTDLIRNLLLIL